MIKYRLILLILGALLLVESFFLGITTLVSLYYNENDLQSFIICTSLTLVIGLLLFFTNKNIDKNVGKREAYLSVSLSWVFLSLFGALPFYISNYMPSYSAAYFETMSGFTTTGATALSNIEALPHGLLFWRSLTQWMGGMGIIVLSIAVLPFIKFGLMQLFVAEVPGISTDKLHPRINQTSKRLWFLYFILTVILVVLLYLGDMPLFDAVCHSFSTLATGGYSTKNASIGAYDSPYIHIVLIIFMIIAGTNFSVIYFAVTGKFKKIIKNTELKFYLFILFASSLIIGLCLWQLMGYNPQKAFIEAAFQVASIMTTTGFVTADFLKWVPNGLWIILLLLMFIGGSSGSTSGGLKVIRVHILLKNSFKEFKRLLMPNAILPIRYNGATITQQTVQSVTAFFMLYLLIVVVSVIALIFLGLDFESSLGAVVTCVSNVGPGLRSVGPAESFANVNTISLWILSFDMLVGRLELFTVLIIFTRTFWKN